MFVDDTFGLPTVQDILVELDKPGRDPRPAFAAATFSEGIEKISDLQPGMVLEGTVTNVAAFGAFVDIGVHQDGLVHVSALANRFVSDPREVVKSGQVVKVKVLEADPERKRISLTLRLDDEPASGAASSGKTGGRPQNQPQNDQRGRNQNGGRGGNPNAGRGGNQGAARAAQGSERGGRQEQVRSGGQQARNAPVPNRGSAPQPAPVNTAMAEALRKALGK